MNKKDNKKIYIITGATSGLGYNTLLEIANENNIVIMAARNRKKSLKIIDKLKKKNNKLNIYFIYLDMIDRKSIYNFVFSFYKNFKDFDVLINNAGVISKKHIITENNMELNFDTNYVGHFLLTNLLLKYMRNYHREKRIITVSSLAAHSKDAHIDLNDINFKNREYDYRLAYFQSKLANALFAKELSNRFKDNEKVKSITVHPGIAMTDIMNDFPLIARFFIKTFSPIIGFQSAKQGAKYQIFAALSQNVKNGDYFGPNSEKGWKGDIIKLDIPENVKDDIAYNLWIYTEEKLK